MVFETYGGVSTSNNASSKTSSNDQNRKIFLGGLSYHTTDESLREFCSRFGKFSDCLVMRNPDGKSRGFGFVTYEDESSVEEFMRARPHTIDDRQIDPKRAMPREDQNSSEAHLTVKKLFVAGLRDGIDENCLRDYFSRFGNVTDVLVMKERDGKPRGFAFVSFDDYDAVDKAILGKPHTVNGKLLDIKKAIPKEKMQEMGFPVPANNNRSGPNGPGRKHYGGAPPRDQYSDNQWNHSNYNQPPMSSYPPSSGYNQTPMSSNVANAYPSSYSTGMGQSQGQSLMNYEGYNSTNSNTNNHSAMSFNNTNNSLGNSSYLPPPSSSSYGSNPAQSYGSMNNQYNIPPPPSNNPNGFSDNSSSSNNSYGMASQNYGANNNGANYNPMGASREGGGGPMRGGRGGGYGGNSNNMYGQRSAPYSARGGGRGGGAGRGRGRGQ